jgi:enamine deaminase RidA (YjgF/YER057c/UK114 family)
VGRAGVHLHPRRQHGVRLGHAALRSADRFKAFNEVYKRYFPKNPPARIFFCVPEWTGPFDVEVDCVAVTKD